MEEKQSPHVACSRTDTHPFVLGDIYAHKHTDWLVILVGLEHIGNDEYDLEFTRVNDWRTFYATYTASEWSHNWMPL